jgi:hypothetical protein
MSDETYEVANTTPMASGVVSEPPEAVPAPVPPVAAYSAPPAQEHVSFPKRWLVVGGSVIVAFVVLAGTFGAGVAVGHRAGGFESRGGGATMGALPNGGTADGRAGGRMGRDGRGGPDGFGREFNQDQQTQPNQNTQPNQ